MPIYNVSLFAPDAVAAVRAAMPLQVQRVLDDAARDGHETSYAFETEDEASRFVRGLFPEVVADSPSYSSTCQHRIMPTARSLASGVASSPRPRRRDRAASTG